MRTYTFQYTMAGKNVNGKPIVDNTTYTLNVEAGSEAIARRRFARNFYKSVVVTIRRVTAQ